MTERQKSLVHQFGELIALHLRMATILEEMATAHDEQIIALRRDMQRSYADADAEARELFTMASRDIAELRSRIGDRPLPTSLAGLLVSIEFTLQRIAEQIGATSAEGQADGRDL